MQNNIFEVIVLSLIAGSFVLAVIDPGHRPLFADLAKVCVAAYAGHALPKFKAGGKGNDC